MPQAGKPGSRQRSYGQQADPYAVLLSNIPVLIGYIENGDCVDVALI
jgi:hypothetical protein